MVALLDLVDECDGVVGIGDDGLVPAVERELLASEDVFARALALGLEVAGRAEIRPLRILRRAQEVKRLLMRGRDTLERVREVRRLGNGQRVLWIDEEAASAAYDDEVYRRAREDACEVLRGVLDDGEGLRRPGTGGVDDGVKAREILTREVEEILLDVFLCRRIVLRVAAERDDLVPAAQRLGDDFFATRPLAATTAIFMMMTPLWRRTSEPVSFCNFIDYFLWFVIYQTTKYLSIVLLHFYGIASKK